MAHLYNADANRNDRRVEAVYTTKRREDCAIGTCALDLERGILDSISTEPWQTDTCIGHCHYDKRATYKTPKTIIEMLVDIVSRTAI